MNVPYKLGARLLSNIELGVIRSPYNKMSMLKIVLIVDLAIMKMVSDND